MNHVKSPSRLKAFLSYPSEHLDIAREIKQFIRSVGVECWFDKDNLVVGENWDRARRLAQKNADVVVLLCASQTTERDGVYQREINEALEAARDRRLGSVYILPIRLEDVELPAEISQVQYVDKFDPLWSQKLAGGLLRAAVNHGIEPPPSLTVAGARPDEGGIIPREIAESREEGNLQVTWLQYALHGEYWDFVNAKITSLALGGLYEGRRNISEWHGDSGSSWELHISEAYRKGELVSLIVGHYNYFSGAAHPNHGLETINILGPEAGVVTASDIFGHSSEALKFISDYTALNLRQQRPDIKASDIAHYVDVYRWSLFDQFTFNEAGMRLNLSSSSGLPHVLGYVDVYIPWEHVGQFLAPIPGRILLKDSPV